jgi:putative serine protease PepD
MDLDPYGEREQGDQSPPNPASPTSAPPPAMPAPLAPYPPSSPPAPGAAVPGTRPRARLGVVLVAALVGAVVGGAVAGGVVAAVDDGSSRTTIVSEPAPVAARPSTALTRPGDIHAILEKVEPAVVRIDVTSNPDSVAGESGTGTGFIVSPDGVIVTNAHVVNAETDIDDADREVVVTLSNGDTARGRLVGDDPAQDLAVIKIDRDDLPVVELGDSDELQVGDSVVAIGNALGITGTPTVTSGIVSGLGRTVRVSSRETLVDAIQTDAAINPGNSGGPLVDVNGRVIGINTAIADPSSANNIGFAISISSARPVLADLRAGRTPRIAYMGVYTQSVDPDLVELRELDVDSGAYVAAITPGAGAERAGIRKGDVMIQVEGVRVRSNDDVVRIVRRHRPGDRLQVVVLRGDEQKTFTVTLGDLPNA